MTPLQLHRREQQRAHHERRESERRTAHVDSALASSIWNRRVAEQRAEVARRRADRLDAARFNFQLMRWHNARSAL